MSRSGYSYDCDQWDLIRWRGAVKSAIRGARGQAFLREMLSALDALPEKRLIAEELEEGGAVCALGSVGLKRGMAMGELDQYDYDDLAKRFGISPALVREIECVNDEERRHATPEERFQYVRAWVIANLKPDSASGDSDGKNL